MGFRLTPRSMTLDDLELHKFEFSVNFSGFRWGSLQRSPDPLAGGDGAHCPPHPTPALGLRPRISALRASSFGPSARNPPLKTPRLRHWSLLNMKLSVSRPRSIIVKSVPRRYDHDELQGDDDVDWTVSRVHGLRDIDRVTVLSSARSHAVHSRAQRD